MAGLISVQNQSLDTSVGRLSFVIAIFFVALSVIFPLRIIWIYSNHFNGSIDQNTFTERYGVLLENVYGTENGHYDRALTTVIAPFIRNLVLASAVTTMYKSQNTTLTVMYTSLIYLAFLLENRKYKEGMFLARIDALIMLFLSYLILLLTDYVEDKIHYQEISNLFIYGTFAMVGINAGSIIFNMM